MRLVGRYRANEKGTRPRTLQGQRQRQVWRSTTSEGRRGPRDPSPSFAEGANGGLWGSGRGAGGGGDQWDHDPSFRQWAHLSGKHTEMRRGLQREVKTRDKCWANSGQRAKTSTVEQVNQDVKRTRKRQRCPQTWLDRKRSSQGGEVLEAKGKECQDPTR